GPPTSPAEKYLSDARNSLKTSDFTAAVKDLDEAIKSAGDDPLGQQAAILRVALVTALADTGKQMADAYGLGAKEPAARSRSGSDPSKSQQFFSSGKVEIDPRVYFIELSSSFLQIGSIFDARGVNQPDQLRIVNQVVRGNLDVVMKLVAGKPDKDLESRAKKMQADCDKTLKKLGS